MTPPMGPSQKLLIAGGLALAVLGMVYGLWYALVDEHPTLERIGVSLATGFAEAAKGNLESGYTSLEDFRDTKFEYAREVHTHGHLAILSTLLIVLGLVFGSLPFGEGLRTSVAAVLVAAAVLLPLGAMIETIAAGPLSMAFAAVGSVGLIGGLAVVALGFLWPATGDRGSS